MNDIPEWEKKYWAQKMQQLQKNPEKLPHYEPAHIAQNRQRAQQPGNNWKEIDPLTAMFSNQQGLASRGMGPQAEMVQLREGAKYFRKVEAENFGSTTVMVRSCGGMAGVSGKEFEMRQECQCYLIDNLNVVDLGKIDSKKMLNLVEVRAPFLGSILVEKNAIIFSGNQGPRVLKG